MRSASIYTAMFLTVLLAAGTVSAEASSCPEGMYCFQLGDIEGPLAHVPADRLVNFILENNTGLNMRRLSSPYREDGEMYMLPAWMLTTPATAAERKLSRDIIEAESDLVRLAELKARIAELEAGQSEEVAVVQVPAVSSAPRVVEKPVADPALVAGATKDLRRQLADERLARTTDKTVFVTQLTAEQRRAAAEARRADKEAKKADYYHGLLLAFGHEWGASLLLFLAIAVLVPFGFGGGYAMFRNRVNREEVTASGKEALEGDLLAEIRRSPGDAARSLGHLLGRLRKLHPATFTELVEDQLRQFSILVPIANGEEIRMKAERWAVPESGIRGATGHLEGRFEVDGRKGLFVRMMPDVLGALLVRDYPNLFQERSVWDHRLDPQPADA